MPVGIQRLNARHSQPNPHIVFIKPLKGPDEGVARQFLERIAAQCVPVMRRNHISVMTLEEYEPNAEFVGRNFNAGEVIQLVLKTRGARRARQWLPFAYVQMVMMHELAHCKQMNHSRAFWAVRNAYAAEMRQLWAAQYTGEGIWGRGAALGTAGGPPLYERNVVADDDEALLVEHLCGGTYRSRGRKRKGQDKGKDKGKGREQLTYREREDRRVRRKFGVSGVALGDDLGERAKLEASAAPGSSSQRTLAEFAGGAAPARTTKMTKAEQKRLATKPRVAVSKRGRELRAAAALARFDQAKTDKAEEKEASAVKRAGSDDDDDDLLALKMEEEDARHGLSSDDEYEDDDDADDDQPELAGPDAVDIDGSRLLDGQGRGMVRVCEGMGDGGDSTSRDRDAADGADDARRELRELMQGSGWAPKHEPGQASGTSLASIPAWVKPEHSGDAAPPEDDGVKQERGQQPARVKSEQVREQVKREQTKAERREVSLADIPLATAAGPAAPVKSEPVKAEVKAEIKGERRINKDEAAARGRAKDEQRPGLSLSDIPLYNAAAATPARAHPGCGVCSFDSGEQAITCAMCGHVLHPDVVPDAWHCDSAACRPTEGTVRYLNAGDCGVCGVCGQRRP